MTVQVSFIGKLVVGCGIAFFSLGLLSLCSAEHQAQLGAGAGTVLPVHAGRSLLSQKEDAARSIADFKGKLPRWDLTGASVSSDFDPENQKYWESVGWYAGICVVLGVFSLLFGIFFCIFRCCCNCCGGRKPTPGCCCPDKKKTRVYTTCEKMHLCIGMLIVIACVTAMSILGYVGNADFSVGIDNFLQTIEDVAANIKDRAITLGDRFAEFSSLTGIPDLASDAITELKKAFDEVKKAIDSIQSTSKDINVYRELGLNIVYAWCMFLMALGFLGLLCRWAWPMYLLSIFGFLTLFFVWILFGIHFPVSIVIGDMCRAVVTYIDDRQVCEDENYKRIKVDRSDLLDCSSSAVSPVAKNIDSVVQCQGQGQQNEMDEALWKSGGLILYGVDNESKSEYMPGATPSDPSPFSIRGILKFCSYGTWIHVGKYRPQTTLTNRSTTMYGTGKLNEDTLYEDVSEYDVRARIGDAVDVCFAAHPELKELGNFSNYVEAYGLLWNISGEVYELTSCKYVFTAMKTINDRLCVDTLQSLDFIAGSFGALGFLFWFAEYYAIKGFKRMSKRKSVKPEPDGKSKPMVQFVMA